MGGLGTSEDANVKAIGSAGTPFFLGKVVGIDPDIDVAAQYKLNPPACKGGPRKPS
jgi:hypothetical protein